MDQYPIELTVSPVPVVALVYLPHFQQQIVKSLSESVGSLRILTFKNEESLEKKKVSFISFLIHKKPKRNFENYKPEGIIKRGWMKKMQVFIKQQKNTYLSCYSIGDYTCCSYCFGRMED